MKTNSAGSTYKKIKIRTAANYSTQQLWQAVFLRTGERYRLDEAGRVSELRDGAYFSVGSYTHDWHVAMDALLQIDAIDGTPAELAQLLGPMFGGC